MRVNELETLNLNLEKYELERASWAYRQEGNGASTSNATSVKSEKPDQGSTLQNGLQKKAGYTIIIQGKINKSQ